jgi:hypothetical protein
MSSRIVIPGALVGALLAACTAPQTPVPVVGAAPDLRAIAGRWAGSYASAATGRSGSISFTLSATGDSAFGDVVMIPRGWGQPLQAWDREGRGAAGGQPRSAVLTINFVRVTGGRVSGTLAPYADPETGARLVTTFAGRLSGDTIAGSYTTRGGSAGDSQSGQWAVTRARE